MAGADQFNLDGRRKGQFHLMAGGWLAVEGQGPHHATGESRQLVQMSGAGGRVTTMTTGRTAEGSSDGKERDASAPQWERWMLQAMAAWQKRRRQGAPSESKRLDLHGQPWLPFSIQSNCERSFVWPWLLVSAICPVSLSLYSSGRYQEQVWVSYIALVW